MSIVTNRTVMNRQVEAEPLMRRALAITERSFGPVDPNVAITLNNLGSPLMVTNKKRKAESITRSAVSIFVELARDAEQDHSNLNLAVQNYRQVLAALRRSEAEIDAVVRQVLEGSQEPG